MDQLPDEMVMFVFSMINTFDQYLLKFVCRYWWVLLSNVKKPKGYLITMMIETRDVKIMDWVLSTFDCKNAEVDAEINAASLRSIYGLEWLHSKQLVTPRAYGYADSVSLFGWLKCHNIPITSLSMEVAITQGNIVAVRWLRSKLALDKYDKLKMCQIAADENMLEVFRWLISNFKGNTDKSVYNMLAKNAAMHNRINIIQEIRKVTGDLPANLTTIAATHGSIEVLRNLYYHRPEAENIAYVAAREGRINVLDWLVSYHSRDSVVLHAAAIGAANRGRSEVITWLNENALIILSDIVYEHAVRSGNLDLLKQLQSLGCPRCVEACDIVVVNRRLDILKWMGDTYHKNVITLIEPSTAKPATSMYIEGVSHDAPVTNIKKIKAYLKKVIRITV